MNRQFYANAGLLVATAVMLSAFEAGELSAQEKCKMKWKIPAANANYTEQHVIDSR